MLKSACFSCRSLRSLTSSWVLVWKTRCSRSCLSRSRPGLASAPGSRCVVTHLLSRALYCQCCLPILPLVQITVLIIALWFGLQAFVAIGDYNGHVGLGVKCSKEVATAIRGAIILAKLSIVPVRRGYWGNKIGKPHTVPCKVTGRCGSVLVRLIPAPRGTGIVSAPVPKKLLMMAGIDDCYTSARGCTATLGNFGKMPQMIVSVFSSLCPASPVKWCCCRLPGEKETSIVMHGRKTILVVSSVPLSILYIFPKNDCSSTELGPSSLISTHLFSLQPRPPLMPSPRLTATWLLICGRRLSSPSLPTRYGTQLILDSSWF